MPVMSDQPLPLSGLRVVDCTVERGELTARLLGDLGADVVKVEPLAGDQMRGIERPFFSAQAGKRALAANLKDPALAGVIAALLQRADVVHHNLRPGAAERLIHEGEQRVEAAAGVQGAQRRVADPQHNEQAARPRFVEEDGVIRHPQFGVGAPGSAKNGAFGTGCGDGHATPKWVPYSNLGCYAAPVWG